MLERLHNFSLVCAIILASGCLGSLVGSLKRSKGGRVPVYQVVLHELPIVAHTWFRASFLADLNQRLHLYLVLFSYIAIVAGALYRLFSYSNKRDAFERESQLVEVQQTTQEVPQVQIQVMSQQERAKYLKVQQPPQRRSRYSRDPVI